MSKKIGNKELAIILIVLVAIYGISRYISMRKGENTFQEAIIPHIDTTKITSVIIYGKIKKGHPIRLDKKGKTWFVSQDNISSLADQTSPDYIIRELRSIDPDRLATNDAAQWKDYEVSDTAGTRITLLGGNDTMLDVIVGKFGFMAEQRKGISYVRINHQVEVYGVEGFLSMNIAQEFDQWRDRKIIPSDPPTWTRLTYTYPGDSSFSIQKDSSGKWRFADGAIPDSLSSRNNLNSTSQQNYGSFVNKFDTNAQAPLFTLKIEVKEGSPTILKAYAADTTDKYIITSSMDPGAYFSGAKSSLFNKIFLGKKAYFHHDQPKQASPPTMPKAMGAPTMKKGKK